MFSHLEVDVDQSFCPIRAETRGIVVGGHLRAKPAFIFECDKMQNMTLIDALREDAFFLQGFVDFSLVALFIACVLITACFSKCQKVFKSKTNENVLISSEITPV